MASSAWVSNQRNGVIFGITDSLSAVLRVCAFVSKSEPVGDSRHAGRKLV